MVMLPTRGIGRQWVEDRVHKKLNKANAKEDKRHEGRIALSQIGKCGRMLWLGMRYEPQRKPQDRILVLFGLGNAIEAHVVDILRKAGFHVEDLDPETGEQYRIEIGDKASGRTDGIIDLWPDKPSKSKRQLLEIKSAKGREGIVSPSAFRKLMALVRRKPEREEFIKKSPSDFESLVECGTYKEWNEPYWAQVQVYMLGMGLDSCIVVVYNKNTSALYVEEVPLARKAAEGYRDKALKIQAAATVLDRPPMATSKSCAYCKWCDYSEECWDGAAGKDFGE